MALKTLNRIQRSRGDYKDVPALIVSAKTELMKQEARRACERALAAMRRDDWDVAVEELCGAVRLDADNAEYSSTLKDAEQQRLLARLYADGLTHYQARHWPEAQECFGRIIKIEPAYKDDRVGDHKGDSAEG